MIRAKIAWPVALAHLQALHLVLPGQVPEQQLLSLRSWGFSAALQGSELPHCLPGILRVALGDIPTFQKPPLVLMGTQLDVCNPAVSPSSCSKEPEPGQGHGKQHFQQQIISFVEAHAHKLAMQNPSGASEPPVSPGTHARACRNAALSGCPSECSAHHLCHGILVRMFLLCH